MTPRAPSSSPARRTRKAPVKAPSQARARSRESVKPGRRQVSRRSGGQHKYRTRFRAALRTTLIAALIFAAAWAAVMLLQLDAKVRAGFHAASDSTPVRLYSRPTSVVTRGSLSVQQLTDWLDQRAYQPVEAIKGPGDYAVGRTAVDVFLRAGGVWNDHQPARAIRVMFRGARVEKILSHQTGQPVKAFRLAPEYIGTLEAGPSKDQLPLKLHEAPDALLDALLTMEDRRFESHIGVDPRGVARALWNNVRGRPAQGASTLTQQLVKNIYLNPGRTLTRKFKEAMMALLVEAHFSKAEILERYLNEIFLGQSGHRAVHGFRLAARFYFGKSLSQLDTGEIAMLVGLIPAPSAYNPFRSPKRAQARRDLVLDTMSANGKLDAQTAMQHKANPLEVVSLTERARPRYHDFLDLIQYQLNEAYTSVYFQPTGYTLYTTLMPEVQEQTEHVLQSTLSDLEVRHDLEKDSLEGAVIVLDPRTGEVLAMVGSRYPRRAGFNRALDARRPIGSLIKPVVYLTALSHPASYSLVTPLDDSPISVTQPGKPDWRPGNYDGKSHPDTTLLTALAHSYNLATVRLGMGLGVRSVVEMLHKLGMTPENAYPSLLLGAHNASPYEVAQVYQTLANGGQRRQLRAMRQIADQDGVTIARFVEPGLQVANPAAVYVLNAAMKAVVQSGTARALGKMLPGVSLAGKTGTTDDFRDSWFAGYGQDYLAVVWVGNDQNRSIRLSGAQGALQVWARAMQSLGVASLDDRLKPDGVVELEADIQNGGPAVAGCSERTARLPFVAGYIPVRNPVCMQLAASEPPGKQRAVRWFDRLFRSQSAQRGDSTGAGGVSDDRGDTPLKKEKRDPFYFDRNIDK